MPFKIKSTVSVYEYPTEGDQAGIDHVILSRERFLYPGEVIHVKGYRVADVEGKSWEGAEGEIRVADRETLTIRWRSGLVDSLMDSLLSSVGPGPERMGIRELREWEPKQEIKGEAGKPIELGDSYHPEPKLPEAFDLLDKAWIEPLVEKMIRKVEGMKRVDRKTELVYKP